MPTRTHPVRYTLEFSELRAICKCGCQGHSGCISITPGIAIVGTSCRMNRFLIGAISERLLRARKCLRARNTRDLKVLAVICDASPPSGGNIVVQFHLEGGAQPVPVHRSSTSCSVSASAKSASGSGVEVRTRSLRAAPSSTSDSGGATSSGRICVSGRRSPDQGQRSRRCG